MAKIGSEVEQKIKHGRNISMTKATACHFSLCPGQVAAVVTGAASVIGTGSVATPSAKRKNTESDGHIRSGLISFVEACHDSVLQHSMLKHGDLGNRKQCQCQNVFDAKRPKFSFCRICNGFNFFDGCNACHFSQKARFAGRHGVFQGVPNQLAPSLSTKKRKHCF